MPSPRIDPADSSRSRHKIETAFAAAENPSIATVLSCAGKSSHESLPSESSTPAFELDAGADLREASSAGGAPPGEHPATDRRRRERRSVLQLGGRSADLPVQPSSLRVTRSSP